MNQDPNNTSSAFSDSTNATQSNPFTGDLKGEFTSDFGTNTNAVSQMFKGGGPGGDKRKTLVLILGGVVLIAVLVFLMVTEDEQGGFSDFAESQDMEEVDGLGDDEAAQEQDQELADGATEQLEGGEDGQEAEAGEKPEDGTVADGATVDGTDTVMGEETEPMGESMPADLASTGDITVSSPFEGASLPYDETQGPATFSWSGQADRIVFARNSSMSPIIRSVNVAGRQSYRYLHPHPGTFYWRLENAEGGSAPQSFTINSPIRRNFPVSQPAAGGQIDGSGIVGWQTDSKVAFYKVELTTSGGSWSSPSYSYSTSGSSVQLQGVSPGSYDFRVGAFSEVSGRFEWQVIPGVQVGGAVAADAGGAPQAM